MGKGFFLKNWRYYFDLVFLLTKKEIKARYKRTFLGLGWAVLHPFLQMLIIGLIFQFFIPLRIENYFLFIFAGILPWNFFSLSILRTTPLLVQERALIQKAPFPRELLIVSAVLAQLFHTLIASFVFLLFLMFLKTSIWVAAIFFLKGFFWLSIFSIFMYCFTLAASFILSALFVRIRDLIFVVQLGVQLLFYGVPVMYELEMLPVSFRNILYLNPLASFVELFRFVFLNTRINLRIAGLAMLFSVFFLLGSFIFFKKESKNFDDWF